MKLIKTEFQKDVNKSSSYIVYITKTYQEATIIHEMALTQKSLLTGWYYQVHTVDVNRDCRVPEFFHDRGYYATIVEHNRGSWEKEPTYELYIGNQEGRT